MAELTKIDRGVRGTQWRADFPNGYGVSIIQGPHTYGAPEGKFELPVLKDGELNYDTPITDDVIGRLDWPEVEELIERIKALPTRDGE
jgi:hypothetical protein